MSATVPPADAAAPPPDLPLDAPRTDLPLAAPLDGLPPVAGARGVTRDDVFSVLGSLGAVLTGVTAVMFYFGWRRSDVQASAMGVDVSLFGYASQDYVLRSISALYIPLLLVAALGLGWLWVHAQVRRLLRSGALASGPRRDAAAPWSGWVAVAGGGAAAACLLFALLAGLTAPPPAVARLAGALTDRQWVVPMTLVGATLAATYAWWFHRQLRPPDPGDRSLWRSTLSVVLVAGTVSLGVFWMLEEYASAVGRGYALRLAANVGALPHAVVTSPYPLGIAAPGVTEETIVVDGAGDGVLFRTTGLRLLARSGGKVILVHDGWAPGSGSVVVVADSEGLTWQFSR